MQTTLDWQSETVRLSSDFCCVLVWPWRSYLFFWLGSQMWMTAALLTSHACCEIKWGHRLWKGTVNLYANITYHQCWNISLGICMMLENWQIALWVGLVLKNNTKQNKKNPLRSTISLCLGPFTFEQNILSTFRIKVVCHAYLYSHYWMEYLSLTRCSGKRKTQVYVWKCTVSPLS